MKKIIISLFVLATNVYASELTSVMPFVAHGDLHAQDRVVNLKTDQAREFILDDYSQGLELIATRKVFASAGVLLNFSQAVSANTFGWGALGLFPLYNSFAKFYHRFDSLEAMEQFEVKIPNDAETLDTYRTGDAAFFTKLGGVSLNLVAGIGQIGLGPKVFLEGGFSFYVEKKDDNKVYVEMRNIFTHNYALLAGTWIAFAELTKLVERSKGFGFELDLNDQEARELYRELVQEGRIDKLQNSSRQAYIVSTVDARRVTNKKKMALGTPIIPLIEFFRSKELESTEEFRESNWAGEEEVVRVVSLKKRSNRFFKRQRFKETVAISELEAKTNKRKLALVYEDHGNRFNFNKLARSINRLKSMTGLSFLDQINPPQLKEKLGNITMGFSLSASDVLINKLIEKNKIKSEKDLAKLAQSFWRNSSRFNQFYSWIKSCGGELDFTLSGQRLAQISEKQSYESNLDCTLD
jgi:hypothetical protein